MAQTEAQKRAVKKYKQKLRKENKLKTFRLDLFEGKHKDIIDYLAKCDNQRNFIIEALREKIKRENK